MLATSAPSPAVSMGGARKCSATRAHFDAAAQSNSSRYRTKDFDGQEGEIAHLFTIARTDIMTCLSNISKWFTGERRRGRGRGDADGGERSGREKCCHCCCCGGSSARLGAGLRSPRCMQRANAASRGWRALAPHVRSMIEWHEAFPAAEMRVSVVKIERLGI
jgi:hypothetical protein